MTNEVGRASPSETFQAVTAPKREGRVTVRDAYRQRREAGRSKYVALNDSGDGRGPHK